MAPVPKLSCGAGYACLWQDVQVVAASVKTELEFVPDADLDKIIVQNEVGLSIFCRNVLVATRHESGSARKRLHRPAPGSQSKALDAGNAAGALLDWRFHSRLSVEASFLARRFGHSETTTFSYFCSTQSVTGYSWEVPLLLKWRAAQAGPAAFWLGAGPALRRASHIDWMFRQSSGNTFRLDGSFIARSAAGAAAAGGIEVRAGAVRLRPELRYTWFDRPLYDLFPVATRQDSLFFVLGVSRATVRR